MENENVFENIDEVLSNLPANYNILEEEINIEVQKEFYEASQTIQSITKNDSDIQELIQKIHDDIVPIEALKYTLLQLSFCDSVKAYRALEKYQENTNPLIKDWAILALQQSRMILHSSLLGEQQVFISTGLGGKNKKLRYFFIFPFNSGSNILSSQQEILRKELDYFITNNDGEVEEMEFDQQYATATTLIPLEAPISTIVRNLLDECNQYGNYLGENILITNMKKFNHEEITELISHDESE